MSVAGFPDADGDGRGDFAVGAPSASFLGLQHVGRLHVYTGGTLVNSIYPLNIAEGVFFAHSLAGCSDMTGDGRGDIIVGSPDESPKRRAQRRVRVHRLRGERKRCDVRDRRAAAADGAFLDSMLRPCPIAMATGDRNGSPAPRDATIR
jgi:hypothetical protein